MLKWFHLSSLGEYISNRGLITLLIGPLAFVSIYFAPFTIPDVQPEAKTFLAIFVWVAIQWLITSIPMFATGLMGVSLAVLFGVTSSSEGLAPFANPIIFLFLGGFLLAKAMEEIGLDKKMAIKIITHPSIKGQFKRTFVAILFMTAIFSMWISNTATTAMMLPILLGLLRNLDIRDQSTKSLLLLSMAYAATIGGLGTPIGSPPNVIAVGMLYELAEIQISFLQWMMIGLPVGTIALGALILLVFKKIPQDILNMPIDTDALKKVYSSTSLSFSEKAVIATFGTTVTFWFLPSIMDIIAPNADITIWMSRALDPAVVVLLALIPLFFLPLNSGEKILNNDSIKSIDWSSLLLFGSGLSLGGLLFKTGLAQIAGQFLVSSLSGETFILAMIGVIIATVFFTEFTSNTASANILLPIIIAGTLQMGITPSHPALMVAFACNLAFMLPVATPPNAIVFGSGQVEFRDMLRWGLMMNAIGIGLISIYLVLSYFF